MNEFITCTKLIILSTISNYLIKYCIYISIINYIKLKIITILKLITLLKNYKNKKY